MIDQARWVSAGETIVRKVWRLDFESARLACLEQSWSTANSVAFFNVTKPYYCLLHVYALPSSVAWMVCSWRTQSWQHAFSTQGQKGFDGLPLALFTFSHHACTHTHFSVALPGDFCRGFFPPTNEDVAVVSLDCNPAKSGTWSVSIDKVLLEEALAHASPPPSLIMTLGFLIESVRNCHSNCVRRASDFQRFTFDRASE